MSYKQRNLAWELTSDCNVDEIIINYHAMKLYELSNLDFSTCQNNSTQIDKQKTESEHFVL